MIFIHIENVEMWASIQELVTVGVDASVLERIAKIMSYLRLGSSGKVCICCTPFFLFWHKLKGSDKIYEDMHGMNLFKYSVGFEEKEERQI